MVLGAAALLGVGWAATEEGKELQALARKAGALKSYTFTVEQKPGPGAGRPVEGKYQAGQPTSFTAEGIAFYRKGDVLVYHDGGRWQRSRTGRLSDPLRILGAAARVRGVALLPHEELARLPGDLSAVKRAPGKAGATLYTGTLTAAALKRWAPTPVRSVVREGTVRVWAAGGRIVRYAVTLRLKGRLGDAEVDGSSTRTVELRRLNTTRVEVPAPARKALE
jgi:hypothetical protein